MTTPESLSQPVARTPSARHIPIFNARNEDVMPDTNYDAIVVGSGISGGWAAKELAEKGLRVLLLERGPGRVAGICPAIRCPETCTVAGTFEAERLRPATAVAR